VILIHNGKRQHRVPHGNKADHVAMKGLKDAVVNNASVTAAKLVVGTPLCDSVGALHESFGNKDRIGYFRRRWLQEMGVTIPGICLQFPLS